MTVFKTIVVAFSMFSSIPMPQIGWTARSMRYALVAFPFVGCACAAALAAWAYLAQMFGVSELLRAVGMTVLPLLVTGGIHLDGFADTSDALCSHGDSAKRLEILADPHVGAFAVIRVAIYLLMYVGLASSLRIDGVALACMSLGFVAERALGGLAIASFPTSKDSGLAHCFSSAADCARVRLVLSVLTTGLGIALVVVAGWFGVGVCLACSLSFAWLHHTIGSFGGVSGDLIGWFIQVCELGILASLVIVQLVGGVL